MLSKGRKVDEEFRAFKEEWENNFFFVNHLERPTCVICHESIAFNKEYNIKRHYESKHKMFLTSYLTKTFNNKHNINSLVDLTQ